MFQKGNPGRPKGSKNDPGHGSLKVLLNDAFVRNRSAAIAKIDSMFTQADLADFKWLCNVKASLEPRELPAVVDNSVHHHYTTIQVESLDANGLMDLLMQRNNERLNTQQPA